MATNKSPTTSWIYDLEVYPNMFEASFIPYGVPQDVIDLYILETIHKKNLDVRFCNYSAVDTVLRILNNFSNSNSLSKFVIFFEK